MSQNLSPHLPELPTENAHRRDWYRAGFFIVLVVCVLGVAGAALGVLALRASGRVQIVERSTPVFVPQDATSVVNAIDRSVLRGVLSVYLPQAVARQGNLVIDARDRIGAAVVLTNDGWIVSTKEVLKNTGMMIAVSPGVFAAIEKTVIDPATPLVFAKIKNTSLSALPFAKIETGTLTDIAAIPTVEGILRAMIINGLSVDTCGAQACIVKDARVFTELGMASPLHHGVLPGMPLLNRSGEVIGIVSSRDSAQNAVRFIPANAILPMLDAVFSAQPLPRPQLPITYVDLSYAQVVGAQLPATGARVVSVAAPVLQKQKKKTSAGFIFQKNDVIIAIAGTPLSRAQSLATILMNYKAGDTVPMQILRDGKEITADVILP